LLECRRQAIGERRLKPIRPIDIIHSKSAALEKFAPLLNGDQFTRLYALMKDLALALIYLVRPENGPKITRGDLGKSQAHLRR
jgi:hypothetical protein